MPSTAGDPDWCLIHRCDMREVCTRCSDERFAAAREIFEAQLTAEREKSAALRAALEPLWEGASQEYFVNARAVLDRYPEELKR
jgi:hypothetical protein